MEKKQGKFLFESKNFKIINNGINIDKYIFNSENKEKYKREFNLNNEFVIGLIARFDEQKNHKFLLEVFNEYQKLNPNSKLILIGEGKLETQIKSRVKELELENKVLFLGRRMDAYKIYSLFDIYLMPSLFEGLSISIVEAQVNGLKCYTSTAVDKSSNICGNVEFLDLELGAKKWAETILKSYNNRDKSILKKIPKEYDIKNTVFELMNIYFNK